ncbi:Alpha/Beta hydrolase protein [Trametes elegans]|nr:Alpha/Beta hydrolase protein [Trametes elegans]
MAHTPFTNATLDEIRAAHARQLAQLRLPPVGHHPPTPEPLPTPSNPMLPTLLKWIEENPAAVNAAKETQCRSSSLTSPNWDAVFFTLIESAALALRKESEMDSAVQAAQDGHFDEAVKHLNTAQQDIDEVARALDCTFVQLCDFAERGPDGTWYQSGAYCGLFISNQTHSPFMGIAFKGSTSPRDIGTDIDWQPIAPLHQEHLWGAQTHSGFYLGLFGRFTSHTSSQVPFDVLVEQLSSIYKDNARLHFTGHSLGAAFSTLAYAEFLRRSEVEQSFHSYNFGEFYSFGSPRTCLAPFYEEMRRRTTQGSGRYIFRIVNKQDPIATIPPPSVKDLPDYPYIHVGPAWKISEAGPVRMRDEPPPEPPLPLDGTPFQDHGARSYYASWLATPHS